MKTLLLSLVLLSSIGGSANAYLCAPTVPPTFPSVGWCEWQPDPTDHAHPNVTPCGLAPGHGELYLYSGASFTGSCAKVTVPAATYIMFDYIAVELNGWFAFANSSYTQVRSWRLGGAGTGSGGTAVYFGDGADYWSSPHLCQSVNQTSVSLDQASYPFCNGHFFAPTVIYLYDW